MQENITLVQYFKRYLKRCITGPWSLICGLSVSLKYFLSPWKIVTEQYPENKKTLRMHERYRGRLEMVEDEEGNNHCTACGMCERACPNASINVLPTTKWLWLSLSSLASNACKFKALPRQRKSRLAKF